MSDNYPGTNVPFEGYALPDLHDPIVLGPGAESLQATSQVYGSLAETLTVTAESPVVDVKSSRREQVVNRELLSSIPSARTYELQSFARAVTLSPQPPIITATTPI